MIGRAISHYRMLDRIGAGGMGVVYLARDTRLERDVALKILPEESLRTESDRARLRGEALALSRLNHPAIATIHDFDTAEGIDFIVMEHVLGETLEAVLAAGPLPEARILGIGAEIADALDAAHELGVLHRDLKPANIVFTPGGRAKLLYFGLAKVLAGAGEAPRPVEPGQPAQEIAGTLPYMAPEQLMGLEPTPRLDIYSLGVVLYEMSTGRTPHSGSSSASLMYDILHEDPTPPRAVRPELSARLEAIILGCLERSPERRIASAREVLEQLRRVQPGRSESAASGPEPDRDVRSLVVLPLENLSSDPEEEFFADGMTDALISDLAQLDGLRLISRTSAMRYRDAGKTLPEIARELSVHAVVEGSVLRAGDRVRVSVQLIDASTDRHLWARSYEREIGDVLRMQGEVAQAIAREIQLRLSPGARARLASPRAVNPQALEAFLRGRYFWFRRSIPDIRRAITYFEESIGIDPEYAAAHAGLADAYCIMGSMHAMPSAQACARVRQSAERALELDGDLAEAHTSLAYIAGDFEWDWEGAERGYLKAIRLNPNHATAHQWYSSFLGYVGRLDEALVEMRKARELDPMASIIYANNASTLYYARRYDEAERMVLQALEVTPDYVPLNSELGRIYEQQGRLPEAIEQYRRALKLTGGSEESSTWLGHAFAISGRTEEARAILEKVVERARREYVSPYAIASIHAGLGDARSALDWLERAHHDRDFTMVFINVNPRFDGLRGEPGFQSLVRKMGFPRPPAGREPAPGR